MIYLFILLYVLFFLFQYEWNNKKAPVGSYRLLLLFMILVTGLRYRVGIDTLNYMDSYEYWPDIFSLGDYDYSASRVNFLYILLGAIAKTIGKEFFWLQLLQSIIVNLLIFRFIKNNTLYKFTAVLVYFLTVYFHYNIEIMKQGVAISFFLVSCKYYIRKEWLKYYFVVLIAVFFHTSAVFLFLLPFISWIRLNTFFFILSFIVYFLSYKLKAGFLGVMLDVVLRDGNNVTQNYFQGGWVSPSISYQFLQFFSVYIIPVSLIRLSSYLRTENKFEPFLCIYALIGLIAIHIPIFLRFTNYFILIYIIYVANLVCKTIQTRKFKLLTYQVSFVMVLFFSMPYLGKQFTKVDDGIYRYHALYPYHSIFDPKIEIKREIYRDNVF